MIIPPAPAPPHPACDPISCTAFLYCLPPARSMLSRQWVRRKFNLEVSA